MNHNIKSAQILLTSPEKAVFNSRNAQEGVETREAAYQMKDSVRALETRARPPYDKERWRQELKHFCTASIRGLQFNSLKSPFPINPENLDLRGRPNNIKRPASRYDHATPQTTRPRT